MIIQYTFRCCYASTNIPWYKFGWFREPITIKQIVGERYLVPKHNHTSDAVII